MIKLRFDKLYSKDRIAQPCYVSIPLAKGVLPNEKGVQLYQNGKVLKQQVRVLSRYEDGSVRYLFVRFLADIPANKTTEVECDFGTEYVMEQKLTGTELRYENEVSDICWETLANGYRVETGAMCFTVQNGTTHLFEELQAQDIFYKKEQFVGPVVKEAASGELFSMQYGVWEVIEAGVVCVVLSNKGKLLPTDYCRKQLNLAGLQQVENTEEGILCEARVTAYAGRSYADIELRLINATEEALEIAAYEFAFQSGTDAEKQEGQTVRTCVASSNYKTDFLASEQGETVEKEITAEFLLKQSNEHFAEVYYGTFFADVTTKEAGVCATVYQAQQNFPKAVSASKDGIVVKLVPEGGVPVKVQSGVAIAQQFQLYFHDKEETLQDINHQTILYQMPDQPILESEIYEQSGLYPDIFVDKEKQIPDVECALMMTADNHTRSYGMMNWGDAPDPHYTAQGRGDGCLVWTNNEYDFPHACMLEFIRTGVRRFFDYCVVAGTHQMNVDVCHYSKDELLYGGQWEHTSGHCFGDMVCSHEWVEGLLDCYHLTGDKRFFDTAIGIGENVLRLLDTPLYQQNGGLNARETGWALRTLTALYRETSDKKWTTKSDWIVMQFKEWAERFGGWLAPYTDNTVIRVPFMISVAVGSLMRYYREFPREDIKELILIAVDDMVENCVMDNGYFYYKELPSLSRVGNNPLVLEALAIAYELTGEKKYLEAGKRTFDANVSSSMNALSSVKRISEDAVLVGNTGTKRFAQMMVPMAVYYSAIARLQ